MKHVPGSCYLHSKVIWYKMSSTNMFFVVLVSLICNLMDPRTDNINHIPAATVYPIELSKAESFVRLVCNSSRFPTQYCIQFQLCAKRLCIISEHSLYRTLKVFFWIGTFLCLIKEICCNLKPLRLFILGMTDIETYIAEQQKSQKVSGRLWVHLVPLTDYRL